MFLNYISLIRRFLQISEGTDGGVAVHCKGKCYLLCQEVLNIQLSPT